MTEKARSPKKIWCRLILALVLIVGAAVLIPLGRVAWEFAGGWDGIRPQAEPTWGTVVTAREEALAALPAQQDELDALITPITGEPRARGTLDGCTKGVNNWKIHHGYTLSCATAAVAVYPWPNDPAAFHQLTTTLAEHGYQPVGEHSALRPPEDMWGTSGWYTSGSAELRIDIRLPDDLTQIIYPRDDAYSDDDTQAVDAVIRSDPLPLLVMVVSRPYFED
ncbi:hypothetical protein EII34_14640 [Arachnia propionica]|uniref:Uncharacterized protein n=1 Tax=Arachnia propionica TaxID=1750 RepID=A0A3P1T1L5_9ACTN|nr:hypothetical protein [Arachnia propionica]RRD03300.1 hypothetical protein EII34_14640 [Arachnia propionica]